MAQKAPKWKRDGFKTRRRYEDSRARKVGFKNYAEFQRLSKSRAYRTTLDTLARASGVSRAKLRRMDSDFSHEVAEGNLPAIAKATARISRSVTRAKIDAGEYQGGGSAALSARANPDDYYEDDPYPEYDYDYDDLFYGGDEDGGYRDALVAAGVWR